MGLFDFLSKEAAIEVVKQIGLAGYAAKEIAERGVRALEMIGRGVVALEEAVRESTEELRDIDQSLTKIQYEIPRAGQYKEPD